MVRVTKTRAPWRSELREVWLFEQCTDRELDTLTRWVTSIEVPASYRLTTEGSRGRECFVVVAGAAVALREGVELGRIGPGRIFGEMALLDGGPRAATVSSLTPMTLLVISDRDFDAMLDVAVPSVSRRILRVLTEHLRRADERVEHTAGAS